MHNIERVAGQIKNGQIVSVADGYRWIAEADEKILREQINCGVAILQQVIDDVTREIESNADAVKIAEVLAHKVEWAVANVGIAALVRLSAQVSEEWTVMKLLTAMIEQ